MVVTDECLELISKSFKIFKVFVLSSCEGISIDGLASIAASSSKALNDYIKRCKSVNPTPIQRYAIPVALAGRDLMTCAHTGKTAAFCFPIISSILEHKRMPRFLGNMRNRVTFASPLALILAPTRELSCQIFEEAKKFSHQTEVRVVVACGGGTYHPTGLETIYCLFDLSISRTTVLMF